MFDVVVVVPVAEVVPAVLLLVAVQELPFEPEQPPTTAPPVVVVPVVEPVVEVVPVVVAGAAAVVAVAPAVPARELVWASALPERASATAAVRQSGFRVRMEISFPIVFSSIGPAAGELPAAVVWSAFGLVVELRRPIAQLHAGRVLVGAPARMAPGLVLGNGNAVLVDLEDGRKLGAAQLGSRLHGVRPCD